MVKISACLVIRNEEKLIERALKSLKGVVDEIIVVHSGECTDKSLGIAGKYADKIYTVPDRGAGCYNRPFAFSKAAGDWVMYIDADEYLSDELRSGLRKLTEAHDVDGYGFLHETMVGFRPLGKVGYRLCMFRKSKGHVKGYIHEAVRVDGVVKNVNLLLHHRPLYDNYTLRTFRTKWLNWARIQARDMVADGRAKFPGLLYLPLPFAILFAVWLRDGFGQLPNGFRGLKVAFLQGLYNFAVYWNIFKLKALHSKP
ncbi:glycosyltransferase [Candidatus Woesearchaeota archaeon]|nr:glycosyltransferase [Candidatus Woesearchaeota archaeon]